MTIVNRLDQLLRERAAEWKRDITYREISEETGIAESTLSRMKSGGKGIRYDVLDGLCEFFQCQVGDVLVYVPGPGQQEQPAGQT